MLPFAMLALSAVKAISSVSQGYAEKDEANYNASLLGEKADMIEAKKSISYAQHQRLKAKTWGTSMANIGAMGIRPTGSAMAVMMSAQKNIMTDQVIEQFNLEASKKFTLAEAEGQKRAGKRAVRAGYGNGLTSILSGVSDYAMYTK